MEIEKVWFLSQTKNRKSFKRLSFTPHGLMVISYQLSTIRIRMKIVYHLSSFAHCRIELFSIVFSELNCLCLALCIALSNNKLTKIYGKSNGWKMHLSICGPLNEIALEFNLFNAGTKWYMSYRISICI